MKPFWFPIWINKTWEIFCRVDSRGVGETWFSINRPPSVSMQRRGLTRWSPSSTWFPVMHHTWSHTDDHMPTCLLKFVYEDVLWFSCHNENFLWQVIDAGHLVTASRCLHVWLTAALTSTPFTVSPQEKSNMAAADNVHFANGHIGMMRPKKWLTANKKC